jgi:AraC family transcriptional regulator
MTQISILCPYQDRNLTLSVFIRAGCRMNINSLGQNHNGKILQSRSIADLQLTDLVYEPKLAVPKHNHAQASLCLVRKGAYTELYGQKSIDSSSSMLLFRPAGVFHSDHFGTAVTECFVIDFGPRWLTRFEDYSSWMHQPIGFNDGELLWLVKKIRNEALEAADTFTPLIIEGLMYEIGAKIARKSKAGSDGIMPPWLRRVRNILLDRFRENLTLEYLGKIANVHPMYLSATFKKHHRCGVGEYIRRLRVEFASSQLLTTNNCLADIALEAGFANQSHFSRIFRNATGITPRHYRDMSRGTRREREDFLT